MISNVLRYERSGVNDIIDGGGEWTRRGGDLLVRYVTASRVRELR